VAPLDGVATFDDKDGDGNDDCTMGVTDAEEEDNTEDCTGADDDAADWTTGVTKDTGEGLGRGCCTDIETGVGTSAEGGV